MNLNILKGSQCTGKEFRLLLVPLKCTHCQCLHIDKGILFPGYFVDFTPFLVTNVLDWQQQQQQLSMSFNRWLVGPLTWWLDPIYHGLLLLLNVLCWKNCLLCLIVGKTGKKWKWFFSGILKGLWMKLFYGKMLQVFGLNCFLRSGTEINNPLNLTNLKLTLLTHIP